ncbi:TniQ family protein [Paenibacillus alkaliterrae]|uniref:TniQ family protein n=1 Tax=Paenibacillus alkaliterrae TaxID=320909 RepID=UPI001F18C853|nr:TniQ family protein [Paenibacillus alkaliterrae]MCF2941605.1 TniQ family protein [Paenibacillus alkaliterrae]
MIQNRIYVYRVKEKERRFTWNPGWISPFESMWGVFEKFKYANCATVRNLLQIFGTDDVKSIKSHNIGRIHRDFLNLCSFKDEEMTNAFGIPIKQINEENVQRLFYLIPKRPHNSKSFCRDHLHYCPECIKNGFHSLFHQFKLINECPYHQIPLLHCCPECNRIMPFELSDNYSKAPFQCICGHFFMDMKRASFTNTWRQISLAEIKSDQLKMWINLNEEQISRLNNIYLPHELDVEHYPEALDHILSIIIDGYQPKQTPLHNVVKSSNYIHNLVGESEKTERAGHYYIRKVGLFDEIYNSSVKTLFSIFSHVRNKILKEHKKCIKEFSRKGKTICPYGLAYVHWVQYILGYEDRWIVNRARSYRKYSESIEFASKQDDKFLSDLFHDMIYHVR